MRLRGRPPPSQSRSSPAHHDGPAAAASSAAATTSHADLFASTSASASTAPTRCGVQASAGQAPPQARRPPARARTQGSGSPVDEWSAVPSARRRASARYAGFRIEHRLRLLLGRAAASFWDCTRSLAECRRDRSSASMDLAEARRHHGLRTARSVRLRGHRDGTQHRFRPPDRPGRLVTTSGPSPLSPAAVVARRRPARLERRCRPHRSCKPVWSGNADQASATGVPEASATWVSGTA